MQPDALANNFLTQMFSSELEVNAVCYKILIVNSYFTNKSETNDVLAALSAEDLDRRADF